MPAAKLRMSPSTGQTFPALHAATQVQICRGIAGSVEPRNRIATYADDLGVCLDAQAGGRMARGRGRKTHGVKRRFLDRAKVGIRLHPLVAARVIAPGVLATLKIVVTTVTTKAAVVYGY